MQLLKLGDQQWLRRLGIFVLVLAGELIFRLTVELGVAKPHTGTAVGLVSLIGFTPDIFFASTGIAAYQHYFLLLVIFALLGLWQRLC